MAYFTRQEQRVSAIVGSKLTEEQKTELLMGLLLETHISSQLESQGIPEVDSETLVAEAMVNTLQLEPLIKKVRGLKFECWPRPQEVADQIEALENVIEESYDTYEDEDVCDDCSYRICQAEESLQNLLQTDIGKKFTQYREEKHRQIQEDLARKREVKKVAESVQEQEKAAQRLSFGGRQ
jgi:hypothetical protein